MKKILVVTPLFPFEMRGACPQDRAYGISLLRKLGYDVSIVAMSYTRQLALVEKAQKDFDVPITPILYTHERTPKPNKILKMVSRILDPRAWDGASYEFNDSETQTVVARAMDNFKPDLVWFDYSNLWPLYPLAIKRNIPIITRSINFEPNHFYGKTQKTLIDWLKYKAKVYGERQMIRMSDFLFSITLKEKTIYEMYGAAKVAALPLRRLGVLIGKNRITSQKKNLDIFFMGSNYEVAHMYQSLMFILKEVNTLLQERYPGTFTLHILGGKIPAHAKQGTYQNVVFHDFVENLDAFLASMDISLSPSLSGEGMQQKVFEPIVRGIPTVTSERALVGYPFYNGVHVVTADESAASFVHAIASLRDESERQRISTNAVELSEQLFNETLITDIIDRTIKNILNSKHV